MKKTASLLLVLLLAAALLAGCGNKKEDTRQHIQTIGVVFTNDMNKTFNELYVFPHGSREMGYDHIQNTREVTRVGSYGVTLEPASSYDVLVRDNRGGVYEFYDIRLANVDEGVINFDEQLTLTIHHRSGGSDVVEGKYIPPDDALSQPYEPLQQKYSYRFNFENATDQTIRYISMREADNQARGDVELYIDALTTGKAVTLSGQLFEEDYEIKPWVLYVETEDGSFTVSDPFNPWTTTDVVVSGEGDELAFAFTGSDLPATSAVASSPAAGGTAASANSTPTTGSSAAPSAPAASGQSAA